MHGWLIFVHSTPHRKILLKSIPRYHESWTSLMLPLLIGFTLPSGNRYEELSGKLQEYSSIRVNKQYRLILNGLMARPKNCFRPTQLLKHSCRIDEKGKTMKQATRKPTTRRYSSL